jgi:imidazoleglycerol-phosphate dehydratase
MSSIREAKIERQTGETSIELYLNLDDTRRGKIDTGSGFLDHMLDLFQVHGGFTLEVICKGDIWIDMHHSAEDIAICLGQALAKCLTDKKGIERYGFYLLPMDEALVRCALDFSGRFYIEYNVPLETQRIGNLDTQLFKHFFYSMAEQAKMNLHIDMIRGENTHHIIEGVFKAFARSCSMAVSPGRNKGIPSSKGVIEA